MLSERGKIGFISFVIFCLFITIVLRLGYLQVYKHQYYLKLSKSQSIDEVKIKSERASIYDRNGVLIAKDNNKASLFVYGLDKSKEKEVIKKLRKYNIYKKNISGGFKWLIRNVDVEFAEKVSKVSENIDYIINKKRFYPYIDSLAHILGFTGVDNQGLYGIEAYYEKKLAGEDIIYTVLKDSRGKLITHKNSILNLKNGNLIKITIDSKLQKIAEAILKEDLEKFRANKGIVALMDIKTGEILISLSVPSFDPNNFKKFNKQLWKNPVTHFTFEPGSIFKPVTFAYLFTEKKIDLDKTINCENGAYRVYGNTFNDVHKYKKLSVAEVLVYSSNVGTVKLIDDANNDRFYKFLRKVGFGNPSNVVGGSEEAGLLRPTKEWSKLSKYSLSIGQELYVTPIQMLRFYSGIANGGTFVTPTYIKEIVYNNNLIIPKQKKEQLINPLVAKKIQKLLTLVVEKGTGQNAKSDFVAIAGKTGTAQKFDFSLKRYSSKNYVASFAGYFPADNPQYAMIVVYDSPKSSIYGGSTAAITFRKIAEQVMIYFRQGLKIYRVSDESKRSA
ncbi:penicillin-binding protein 2 [Deferribacter thermophilus]|uniref:peptidoglycan D,D-transpeptidase FtsI family protein n=1 Tax=Deferribacter thermophilus TaxID=53573 RepID=UPI003C1C42A7